MAGSGELGCDRGECVFVCGMGAEREGAFGALGGFGKGVCGWGKEGARRWKRERGGIGLLKRDRDADRGLGVWDE